MPGPGGRNEKKTSTIRTAERLADRPRSRERRHTLNRDLLVLAAGTVVSSALLLTSGLPFASGLAVAVAAFTSLWGVSVAVRNASIVDIFWGLGFMVVGWFYLATVPETVTARGALVCLLVSVWALRLSLFIGIRNIGAGEDFRYRKWRDEAGPNFWWISYFKVFLTQAVLLWIVSSPTLLSQLGGDSERWTALDLIALVMWLVGFLFEAIADWQLARFKNDPANQGQVMRTGLWSLSRHPNYFGEALLWWGIGLLAFPVGGWLSLLGPLMITFLLLRISGVAMLDAALEKRRHGYADYLRSTPAFLPLGGFMRWRQRRNTDGP